MGLRAGHGGEEVGAAEAAIARLTPGLQSGPHGGQLWRRVWLRLLVGVDVRAGIGGGGELELGWRELQPGERDRHSKHNIKVNSRGTHNSSHTAASPRLTFRSLPPLLLPPHLLVHSPRLLLHLAHPPPRQVLILLPQPLALLLRHIELQIERHHFVLDLLDKPALALELLLLVLAAPLEMRSVLLQLGDALFLLGV
jgi:hypothetical protein